MYNRYACRCDEFRRAEPICLEPKTPGRGGDPPPPPCKPQSREKEASKEFSPDSSKSRDATGLLSILNFNNLKIFPKDMDLGDILLFAVLLLLFLEKGDEECLIILLVLLFIN